MTGNRWIDDRWSRDWLFWFAVTVATSGAVALAARTDVGVWRLVVAWLVSFSVTVGVVGFVRTAWRAYREA